MEAKNPSEKLLKKHVAIFASGTGTNAEKIIQHFFLHPTIGVSLIVCNKPDAGVINIAKQNYLPVLLIEKSKFMENGYLIDLQSYKIDFIVLAGFLWKIPEVLIAQFRNRIINIHPALLPKFGGKGMYGQKVHDAVLAEKNTESGITIHYVDEHYDSGDVILQVRCPVYSTDTPDTLAERIHQLEHAHFANVVEDIVSKL